MKVYLLTYLEDTGIDYHKIAQGVVSSKEVAEAWVKEDPKFNEYEEFDLDNVEF